MILSRNIDEQRILQFGWTRGTTCHIQSKEVVLDATFPGSPCQKSNVLIDSFLIYWWSKVLQSNWMRGATGHIKPIVAVSDTTFHWWLTPCKKPKISMFDLFWR